MVMEEVILKIRVIKEGIRDFGRGLAYNTDEMKRNLDMTGENSRAGVRWAVNLKKLFIGLRGFRMELLSVMFFGMGMKNFFMGLLNPALQLTGVFEVISSTLAILFLPIALKVLDWVLWLQDKILELSPNTQKWIGYLVLAGAAIGTFLFLIGMLGLGIGGLIMTFGGLFAIILSLVTSPLALLITAIIALTATGAIITAWDMVKGAFNRVMGIFDDFYRWILGKFPNLKKKLETMGISTTSVSQALKDVWDLIEEQLGIKFVWCKTFFETWWHIIWTKFKWAWSGTNGEGGIWADFKVGFTKNMAELVTIVKDAVGKMIVEFAKIPFGGLKRLGKEYNPFGEEQRYMQDYINAVNKVEDMKIPGAMNVTPIYPSGGFAYPEFVFPPINITIEDRTSGTVSISSNQGTIVRNASSLSTRTGG